MLAKNGRIRTDANGEILRGREKECADTVKEEK